ncbi:MAG: DUF4139 domain-containing protein [Bryobacteraceae bacterium]
MKVIFVLAAALGSAVELPVREVVLYKNGVGYFERTGDVPAGESARLNFKASEMNDVLKSLTIRDDGGARISGVRYDSNEPLERKLSVFPFTTEGVSLGSLLGQLKGAVVELKFGADTVEGSIVLARTIEGDGERAERDQVVLMLVSGELRTFDLGAISGIRFRDSALENQLRDYLRVLAGSRANDKRTVVIDAIDSASRKLAASYMTPAPVWKSSYRLIFGESGDPVLEGWAVVDNTSGEDWNKVQLSLVSGRPVSFISRLYDPKYINRQLAELPEDAAMAPVLYEGALLTQREEGRAAGGAGAGVIGGIVGGVPSAAPPPPAAKYETMAAPSAIAAAAQARDAGELFEYRFNTPVTVRTGESAMLPFIQQMIGGRKLLIYSVGSQSHPMNAAELSNSTGKTLDGGPMTVFDAGVYAGEALMSTLKTDDKRLISYAVDLGTRVTTNIGSEIRGIQEVHLRRGLLTTRSAVHETRTYTIRNVDKKAKTLLIEHPIRPGYALDGMKPVETTSSAYRFEVKLAPDSTQELEVVEERETDSSTEVSNLTPAILMSYVRNKSLNEPARKRLEHLSAIKAKLADIESGIRQEQKGIEKLEGDQERLRSNIESLENVSGQQEQVQKYARSLAGNEEKITASRERLAGFEEEQHNLQSEINSLIETIEF